MTLELTAQELELVRRALAVAMTQYDYMAKMSDRSAMPAMREQLTEQRHATMRIYSRLTEAH